MCACVYVCVCVYVCMYVCMWAVRCDRRTSRSGEYFCGGGGEQVERVAADAHEHQTQHRAQQTQHEANEKMYIYVCMYVYMHMEK